MVEVSLSRSRWFESYNIHHFTLNITRLTSKYYAKDCGKTFNNVPRNKVFCELFNCIKTESLKCESSTKPLISFWKSNEKKNMRKQGLKFWKLSHEWKGKFHFFISGFNVWQSDIAVYPVSNGCEIMTLWKTLICKMYAHQAKAYLQFVAGALYTVSGKFVQ